MRAEGAEFGAVIGLLEPAAWSGEGLVELTRGATEFDISLCADADMGELYLISGGERIRLRDYTQADAGGVYLALTGGAVSLSYIEVARLTNTTKND